MFLIIFQFPLKSESLFVFEWVITFFFVEFSLIYLKRVIKYKKELKSLQERGYFFLFLGFSLMWMFFIIGDYYAESALIRLIYLNLGYISSMITAHIFIYIIESHKNLYKKFLFTKIFAANIAFFLFIFFLNIRLTQFLSFTFWPIAVVFFILYSKELSVIFKLNSNLEKFRLNYLKLVSGILLLIIGFGLTTDIIIINFGLVLRAIGDCLQLVAFIFLYLFSVSMPTFSEYDWKNKIQNLYIIHKSGLLIYHRAFIQQEKYIYDSYISGIMASLKIMLESVSKKEAMSFIEEKGNHIIIQSGKYIYCAIVSTEKLKSLQIILNNLTERIEGIYLNILKEWDGDLKVFRPIDKIVKDYFI